VALTSAQDVAPLAMAMPSFAAAVASPIKAFAIIRANSSLYYGIYVILQYNAMSFD
jgi:hypothetical protein